MFFCKPIFSILGATSSWAFKSPDLALFIKYPFNRQGRGKGERGGGGKENLSIGNRSI